jgi:hypothetical protein
MMVDGLRLVRRPDDLVASERERLASSTPPSSVPELASRKPVEVYAATEPHETWDMLAAIPMVPRLLAWSNAS